jgi:Zn-dependent protease
VHEFAHAKSADLAGDPTPRIYGRVTLNPVKHFDPAGLFMIFFSSLTGFGIGWGKPCPVDPRRMQHPRWDELLVSFWGPFSNILIALICTLILRLTHASGPVFNFLLLAISINLALALFNLIPLFPLDGSWIVKELLPERAGWRFYEWNRSYGVIILLGSILILGPLGYSPFRYVLWPAINWAVGLLLGTGMN